MDHTILKKLYEEHIELKLKNTLPNKDTSIIRTFFSFLRGFYSIYSIDKLETLTIIYSDTNINDLPKSSAEGCTLETIRRDYSKNMIIQLMSNDYMYIWNSNEPIDSYEKSDGIIIYELKFNEEYFFIDKNKQLLNKSCIGSRSIFSESTYTELNEALDKYYTTLAQTSKCIILEDTWTDERRLRLKPAPENSFRNSLWQFLKSSLRNTSEVYREQNVSDKNPIDIKIYWQNSSERALIEVKWLGSSFNNQGNKTNEYKSKRINQGSKQLVDYLEESSEQSPYSHFKGYLIVFDARRKNINTTNQLSNHSYSDSLYYRDVLDEEQLTSEFIQKSCIYKRFFLEPQPALRTFSGH